ncbi:MAG TPA: polyprenol monophosphomannose synthase [Terracidiphilus sp.]|jgi:dolichol-phosphate mannosyltransferase|nr:polyprenol monophosphomannose synthase [Terracidiphilus sp.]
MTMIIQSAQNSSLTMLLGLALAVIARLSWRQRLFLSGYFKHIKLASISLATRPWLQPTSQNHGVPHLTSQIPEFHSPEKREKLALVIPTLCEAENIGAVIGHVRSVLHPLSVPYEIVVVDDDSPDGTGAIVAAIARQDEHVRLLVRKGQRGLSGAVLHGWQNTDATILGVMDADLQHPPELLPKLIAAVSAGRDLAIGSRYMKGGKLGNWNPARKLLSAAAVWATWPIQQRSLRVKDPMSGFFVVRRRCLEGIAFQCSGFKLLLEVLVRGRLTSVEEVPISFGRRCHGASKANLRVGRDYAQLLTRLYAGKFGWGRS